MDHLRSALCVGILCITGCARTTELVPDQRRSPQHTPTASGETTPDAGARAAMEEEALKLEARFQQDAAMPASQKAELERTVTSGIASTTAVKNVSVVDAPQCRMTLCRTVVHFASEDDINPWLYEMFGMPTQQMPNPSAVLRNAGLAFTLPRIDKDSDGSVNITLYFKVRKQSP